jgi:hypothetical protein
MVSGTWKNEGSRVTGFYGRGRGRISAKKIGALRGRRSLRDVYTGFALGLPLVGVEILL